MDILLGCGSNRVKKLHFGRDGWNDLVTVDFATSHNPDVVWDLENLPLPFDGNSADEIHAYDVLEHLGGQGDWKFFFNQFADFWRMLKPGGLLFAQVPAWNSIWAFGDPSHKRIINAGSLVFLSQKQYEEQVGISPMTDYREWYNADFDIVECMGNDDVFQFILRAVK